MSKHIAKEHMYQLPSGNSVHPCRLILRDGTLMWKHALLLGNEPALPDTEAKENHIIKTAQRLEELNAWVSQGLEPWECFIPSAWYVPNHPGLENGISLYFKHHTHSVGHTFTQLLPHIQDHEILELRNNSLYFQRC